MCVCVCEEGGGEQRGKRHPFVEQAMTSLKGVDCFRIPVSGLACTLYSKYKPYFLKELRYKYLDLY